MKQIVIENSILNSPFEEPMVLKPLMFPLAEVVRRFEVVEPGASAFRADSDVMRLLAESYRLQHAASPTDCCLRLPAETTTPALSRRGR